MLLSWVAHNALATIMVETKLEFSSNCGESQEPISANQVQFSQQMCMERGWLAEKFDWKVQLMCVKRQHSSWLHMTKHK